MKTTLWNILNNKVDGYNLDLGIEIPKIQRDYAQGRKNVKANEVREVFLEQLFKSIIQVKEENKHALDLDFIYGINDNSKFIPLDGQQRLTTLYLIHWYLAFKDNVVNEFLVPFSKFKYETRPSTSLFIKKLLNGLSSEDYNDVFKDNKSFKKTVKNKNWYFVNWGNDITIQSMLVMLDAIHGIFKNSDLHLEDLINSVKPPITFNFLQIKDFGLSDNLYVKMNSRGKPLTNFENLKAEFGKFIKESDFNKSHSYSLTSNGISSRVTVEDYFMTKVDTDWSDVFWKLRDSKNIFDDKLLNLLSFISFNELVKINRDLFDKNLEEFSDEDFLISYYSLSKLNLITEGTIINYIDTLDLLALDKQYIFIEFINQSNFYKKTILPILENKQKANYESRLLFHGIFSFAKKTGKNINAVELERWSRLLHNLTLNTIYNSSKAFEDAMLGVDDFLSKYDGDLYNNFLTNSIKGFDTVQTLEEHIKTSLRVNDSTYSDSLNRIENHGYLEGQIISLLVFSGLLSRYKLDKFHNINKADLDLLMKKLEIEFAKFQMIFDNSGLITFANEEFRRALLTYNDYSIYSPNFCFFTNSGRETSWKRLLKETAGDTEKYKIAVGCIHRLFEDISPDTEIEVTLKNLIKSFIANNSEHNWIYYFVKYPILFKSSAKKYIKFFDESRIYVLRKMKYNKQEDPEFMSLVLKHLLKKKEIDVSKIEFGFNDTNNLNQYGIKYIKGKAIKVVYNHDGKQKFYIKPHGKEEVYEKSINNVVEYIESNYFPSL